MPEPTSKLNLDLVREAIGGRRAEYDELAEARRAAVAVVLRAGDGPEMLLIRRAERAGDPWSGHIAFPGGHVNEGDEHARSAAERETLEEVGLVLEERDYVGRLDDLTGRSESVRVSAFVYVIERPVTLTPNHEVQEAFWVSLADVADSSRHVTYEYAYAEKVYPFPAVRVLESDGPLLWGLTYRFVEDFFALLGRPIPSMLWHEEE